MKLHEYQAKELLSQYGVPIPKGRVAGTIEEAAAAVTGAGPFVVKAQVHAGGRGKAGGIKTAEDAAGVRAAAKEILDMRLVTRQTGPEGVVVRRVLVEKAVAIARELYLGILIDRRRSSAIVMASAAGGMEIEEVAHDHPERIIREEVDPAVGLMPFQCRRLGYAIGLAPAEAGTFAKVAVGCWRAFAENDVSLLEINPLVIDDGGEAIALDAKILVDDNALFRHRALAELRDLSDEDPREAQAARHDLNFIGLDGSIGCLVNGAGLAMATMDIIKHEGSAPANFLDVGGSATVETVTVGLKIILADARVKAVLVNIFGGIMRCDVVAESIVAAAKEVGILVPLIVRLEGTNAGLGREILAKSNLAIIPAATMDEAAKKAVEAAAGASA